MLKKDLKSLAVIGPLADDQRDPLCPWSGVGRPEDVVTVPSGIKAQLSPATKVRFAKGCAISKRTQEEADRFPFDHLDATKPIPEEKAV